MQHRFFNPARGKCSTFVASTRLLAENLFLVSLASVSCIKAPEQKTGDGSELQYKPAPATVVNFNGHTGDCNIETLHANGSTTLGDYKLVLDTSWGQGVDIYLQNPQDPMSLICSHPRRRIGGRTNTLQGAVISIDGRNPMASPQVAFQAQTQPSPYFRFVNTQGRTYIAYEEKPGGCNPSTNSTSGTVGDGCIVWGYVKSDRRIRLVNASCIGGYRISGVVDPAKTNLLFNQNTIADLRGHPLNNCFVLTKKLFASQPPVYSPEWDYQPSQPGYPGSGSNQPGGNYTYGNSPSSNTAGGNQPPGNGYPLPPLPPVATDRNFVADVVIDALFTIGQYKLCRDATEGNFDFTSGLACRLGGFLSYSPVFDSCIRECRRLFELKQWQNAQGKKK